MSSFYSYDTDILAQYYPLMSDPSPLPSQEPRRGPENADDCGCGMYTCWMGGCGRKIHSVQLGKYGGESTRRIRHGDTMCIFCCQLTPGDLCPGYCGYGPASQELYNETIKNHEEAARFLEYSLPRDD